MSAPKNGPAHSAVRAAAITTAAVTRIFSRKETQNGSSVMRGDGSNLELAAQFVDQELTPASAALRQELERRLHDAIGQLDEDDREVILMRHFEQLSNQEVAAGLQLTEAAASMRYLRAVRKLRDMLTPS